MIQRSGEGKIAVDPFAAGIDDRRHAALLLLSRLPTGD
jgi:hypothetical protein